MVYDGFIFGNGMTLNLLCQLNQYIPQDKKYLLNIDDFLKKWIDEQITKREERMIYSSIYGNKKNKWKDFESLKGEFAKYYKKYDADIEYNLGKLLFCECEYKETTRFFPAMYNIWYTILNSYLEYLDLTSYIEKYYNSVENMTGSPKYVWTTNFDLFVETLCPQHLHGRFLEKMKKYHDVVYKTFDGGKQYYYRYVWGHNGIGKYNNIQQLHQFSDCDQYFDIDFFFDDNIKVDKMLIYGLGFRNAGYIDDLKTKYERYERAAAGGIIDEHILLRVNAMQRRGNIGRVDVTYFNNTEKEHMRQVLEETGIMNFRMIQCQEFTFSI